MNVRLAFNIADGSFNRYMVECEYEQAWRRCGRSNRFNRYMVECEFQMRKNFHKCQIRFNRYMVECE